MMIGPHHSPPVGSFALASDAANDAMTTFVPSPPRMNQESTTTDNLIRDRDLRNAEYRKLRARLLNYILENHQCRTLEQRSSTAVRNAG